MVAMATLAPNGGSSSHNTTETQKYRQRACQNCARSKMRCKWPSEPGASPCHRCAKIKITCTLPEVNVRRRRGQSTRVGQLEEKLDGIMSLLRTGQRDVNPQIRNQNPSALPETRTQRDIHFSQNSDFDTDSQTETPPQKTLVATVTTPSSVAGSAVTGIPTPRHELTTPPQHVDIVPGFRMRFDEVDRALELYRSAYTPYFPFVPIPATMTGLEALTTTPFLLRTILQAVVPLTSAIQRTVQVWFRQYIAQKVLVERERRLELLQAILVFVAWGGFQFYLESQATDLIQLAETIVLDLGLDKRPVSLGTGRLTFVSEALKTLKGPNREVHTLGDMRAMLGFFHLNSVVATLFRRVRGFTFTPYLGHCCDALIAASEYPSDESLVTLVRMQHILVRVSNATPNLNHDEPASHAFFAPVHMIMTTARRELDSLIQNEPAESSRNVLFWINYHGILVSLYEPAIYIRPFPNPTNLSESSHRTEALWGCLQAAKDFFAAYAVVPLENLGSMPLAPTSYMSFAVVTASRLLFLDDSDWDVSLARRSLDFPAACQTLGDRFEQADHLAESLGRRRKFEDTEKSVLSSYRNKIMWIRQWYLNKISVSLPDGASKNSVSATTTSDAILGGHAISLDQQSQEMSLWPMELDEDFLRAFLDSNASDMWADWQP